ncbi:hypothetical protein [Nostoc sp. NMS4]|uniref:hypothetical protein n=1 Tax=Nostoc sp. NMS4 TaxID=2815390 RepID=UPI0025DDC8D0|nr:hypothetical protein [Nostoc sp. NMS4]MBN3921672.1 hypothetical protein [Nostoc sp. NMS4]
MIKNKQTGVNDIQSDIQSPSLPLNIRRVNPVCLCLPYLTDQYYPQCLSDRLRCLVAKWFNVMGYEI